MTDGNAVLTSPTLLHDLEDPDQREAAWRTFLKRYQPLIYRWSRPTGLNHDDAEEISRCVRARVEPNTWQAFWLTAVGKESGRDVADRLGLTVAAVYMAKRRVGKMLRAEAERL